jgi:hypothetical protein
MLRTFGLLTFVSLVFLGGVLTPMHGAAAAPAPPQDAATLRAVGSSAPQGTDLEAVLRTCAPEPACTSAPLAGRDHAGAPDAGPGVAAAAGAGSRGARPGWPVNLGAPGAGFPYTPTLFDCDHDGADEIFLTGGNTFGLRGDGTFLPGWPTVEMPYMGYGTNDQKPGPSAADLEGDGDTEILWSERDWWAGSAYMWCFNGKQLDGSNLPGFPQQAQGEPSNALDVPFVLGDVDGDGDLEAWGPHTLGNNFVHYRISGFDHLGTRLFTHDLNSAENTLSLYFGDLDGNGVREMFAVASLGQAVRLHAFAPDGAELPGYPRVLYTLSGEYLPFGPPVVADLDGDGNLEILIGTWGGGTTRARAFHHDGTPCAGFPIQIATNHQLFYLGLGDLTGDGVPELIATGKILGADYRIHAIDIATGTVLPGWPYVLPYWPEGFPTVADVDNDGYQEVCVSTDGGDVRAVSRNGQLLAGYPLTMNATSISGVAVGDIDGDGLFELVAATWNGWVYAWDTPGQALPGRADWPLRNVNARNTGVFGDQGSSADVAAGAVPLRLDLRAEPNPIVTSAQLQILRGSPGAGAEVQAVEIYSAAGRLIEVLPAGDRATLSWTPSQATPAGVYFARLRGAEAVRPLALVLIR